MTLLDPSLAHFEPVHSVREGRVLRALNVLQYLYHLGTELGDDNIHPQIDYSLNKTHCLIYYYFSSWIIRYL